MTSPLQGGSRVFNSPRAHFKLNHSFCPAHIILNSVKKVIRDFRNKKKIIVFGRFYMNKWLDLIYSANPILLKSYSSSFSLCEGQLKFGQLPNDNNVPHLLQKSVSCNNFFLILFFPEF